MERERERTKESIAAALQEERQKSKVCERVVFFSWHVAIAVGAKFLSTRQFFILL